MSLFQPTLQARPLQDDIRAFSGIGSGISGLASVLAGGWGPYQFEASNWTTSKAGMSHTSGVAAGAAKYAAGSGIPTLPLGPRQATKHYRWK